MSVCQHHKRAKNSKIRGQWQRACASGSRYPLWQCTVYSSVYSSCLDFQWWLMYPLFSFSLVIVVIIVIVTIKSSMQVAHFWHKLLPEKGLYYVHEITLYAVRLMDTLTAVVVVSWEFLWHKKVGYHPVGTPTCLRKKEVAKPSPEVAQHC